MHKRNKLKLEIVGQRDLLVEATIRIRIACIAKWQQVEQGEMSARKLWRKKLDFLKQCPKANFQTKMIKTLIFLGCLLACWNPLSGPCCILRMKIFERLCFCGWLTICGCRSSPPSSTGRPPARTAWGPAPVGPRSRSRSQTLCRGIINSCC